MRLLQAALRASLRKRGIGVFKINSHEYLNFENLLYTLLEHVGVVNYLHLGAHDGKSFSDPLYHFVRQNPTKTSGVMVEPQENIFRTLEKNMGDLPNIRLVRAAIHPTRKQVSIFSLKNESANQERFSGQSSVFRSRLTSGRWPASQISEDQVTAYSITEILRFMPDKQSKLDVLCIDTEGLDFAILMSIDFKQLCPYLIRFEHNLCVEPYSAKLLEDYKNLVSVLNSLGYQVFTEFNDATAVHESMIPLLSSTGRFGADRPDIRYGNQVNFGSNLTAEMRAESE